MEVLEKMGKMDETLSSEGLVLYITTSQIHILQKSPQRHTCQSWTTYVGEASDPFGSTLSVIRTVLKRSSATQVSARRANAQGHPPSRR